MANSIANNALVRQEIAVRIDFNSPEVAVLVLAGEVGVLVVVEAEVAVAEVGEGKKKKE